MLEKLQYINHINEVLDFGTAKLFVNENDLRDFAWEVTTKNNRISGFKKGIVTKTIPIIMKVDTVTEGIQLRNRLFEVFERDVLAVKHGKIIIGDYYLKCFITESAKSDYLIHKGYMKLNVKISTDLPYWIKETTTKFNYAADGTLGTNLDYNRDYSWDYSSNLIGTSLINANFVSSNFKMTIYGACTNPVITIAGHDYSVNVSLDANEYLTIDSINKTIVKTSGNGGTENCFNLRDRSSYIFEKIPAGELNVSSSGDFKFEVTLFEERGEPKWN